MLTFVEFHTCSHLWNLWKSVIEFDKSFTEFHKCLLKGIRLAIQIGLDKQREREAAIGAT